MPSPLGWTLVALVILCFLALRRRRRRMPLRLADGAPLPDATDWVALFSSTFMSVAPRRAKTRNTANDRMTEVSPTPSVQPVMAPT